MSGRTMRARLDRLGVNLPQKKGPTCRYHGTVCEMGANWPAPYPGNQMDDDLWDWILSLKRTDAEPAEQHPRTVWAIDRHEQVPEAELQQEQREYEELLASLQARNDQLEAQLRDERDTAPSNEGD